MRRVRKGRLQPDAPRARVLICFQAGLGEGWKSQTDVAKGRERKATLTCNAETPLRFERPRAAVPCRAVPAAGSRGTRRNFSVPLCSMGIPGRWGKGRGSGRGSAGAAGPGRAARSTGAAGRLPGRCSAAPRQRLQAARPARASPPRRPQPLRRRAAVLRAGPGSCGPPPGALRRRLVRAAPLLCWSPGRTLAAPGCVGSTFSSSAFFFLVK